MHPHSPAPLLRVLMSATNDQVSDADAWHSTDSKQLRETPSYPPTAYSRPAHKRF